MQKYFITKEEMNNCKIVSDDVNHIKNVMRCVSGDIVIVSDEEREYEVAFDVIEKKFVTFNVLRELENKNEFPFIVDIFQGYPKGDKMEDIIKHSTELGAHEINPTFMKRSVVKLDESRRVSKEERFNKISKEAAEQSFRKYKPTCHILDLKKIDFSKYEYKIICYEESAKQNEKSNFKNLVKDFKENANVAIVIGPEGGFAEEEVTYLESMGFVPCGLGPRILRTETASMYALSAISYESELK